VTLAVKRLNVAVSIVEHLSYLLTDSEKLWHLPLQRYEESSQGIAVRSSRSWRAHSRRCTSLRSNVLYKLVSCRM
jgi:hypothetical protein